ncbi:MAG: hypothetical protein E7022_08755 [Desulfovibrio desulfuricans]|jgi:uncharacterized protein (DUF169 family)|nr:hypothetical protein [Desulfovibrio desulfuricans]
MTLSYQEMEQTLMDSLRLYHHPIAVTFLTSDAEVEAFRQSTPHVTPVRPLTFCQWEIAARMQAKTVLGVVDKLACTNAQVSFGWREIDDNEVKSQAKYCVDQDQARRFLAAKPRMPLGSLKAVAVGPLGKAVMQPSVVHFYCDSLQAYHLAVDYMAATDTHPLHPQLFMSSSACGGSVYTYQQTMFNYCPPCSGSYNAGKTERSESNVTIPGSQIGSVVERLLARIGKNGSSSITRPGDCFPGADICKNCPLIIFKNAGDASACAGCGKS